jgi:hypothetical protein
MTSVLQRSKNQQVAVRCHHFQSNESLKADVGSLPAASQRAAVSETSPGCVRQEGHPLNYDTQKQR